MKVSITIPAYNEEKIIEKTIKETYNTFRKSKYNFEIIVIDDNSSDNTGAIIERLSRRNKKIIPLHKKSNMEGPTGIGSALKLGFKHCTGGVIVSLMGDLSDNPKDAIKMVKKIENGYDIVSGSRFTKGSIIIDYPLIKLLCNRLYNRIFAFLFGMKIKDISSAFKTYRKDVLETVKPESDKFEFTSEIILKSHINGFRITEVPVTWRERKKNEGESKFGHFGSPSFIFFKLPRIGFSYGKLSLILWFKFILNRILSA